MVLMMDTREAVRCLDVYSDNLISLSLLVRASTLQNKTDKEMCDNHQGLKITIMNKQKEAMELALEIVATKNRRRAESDSLVDSFGINAAIERYVLADNQASQALKPPQETFAEGMARIHRKIAAKENELRKTKEASEADPVSASIVNDPAATG
jgi:hypothetical protein